MTTAAPEKPPTKQTDEDQKKAADTTNKPAQPATKNADTPLNPRP